MTRPRLEVPGPTASSTLLRLQLRPLLSREDREGILHAVRSERGEQECQQLAIEAAAAAPRVAFASLRSAAEIVDVWSVRVLLPG
jgi:hypothetical protein